MFYGVCVYFFSMVFVIFHDLYLVKRCRFVFFVVIVETCLDLVITICTPTD